LQLDGLIDGDEEKGLDIDVRGFAGDFDFPICGWGGGEERGRMVARTMNARVFIAE